jgi:hypothetical protein
VKVSNAATPDIIIRLPALPGTASKRQSSHIPERLKFRDIGSSRATGLNQFS